MAEYTILLLRPDYVADTFGHDTFCAHVEGETAQEALDAAREEACKTDGQDMPDDYYCLFCTDGYVVDHQDGYGGVTLQKTKITTPRSK